MIGSLADLASLPGMPTEPTLKSMITADPAFEGIVRRSNGKGDPWEIDLAVAARYVIAAAERKAEEQRAREASLAQMAMDLGLAAPAQAPGFTIDDRRALIEEEVEAMKLARLRGELIDRAGVETAQAQFLLFVQQQKLSFSARLAKRADVSRALQIEIDRLMAADLTALAAKMREVAQGGGWGDGDSRDPDAAGVEPAAAALDGAAA